MRLLIKMTIEKYCWAVFLAAFDLDKQKGGPLGMLDVFQCKTVNLLGFYPVFDVVSRLF